MPRETIEIDQAESGIICSPDSKDIPQSAGIYSCDLARQDSMGMFRGRFADTTVTTSETNIKGVTWLQRGAVYDLIYYTKATIKIIMNFMTAGAGTAISLITRTAGIGSIVKMNDTVRVGGTSVHMIYDQYNLVRFNSMALSAPSGTQAEAVIPVGWNKTATTMNMTVTALGNITTLPPTGSAPPFGAGLGNHYAKIRQETSSTSLYIWIPYELGLIPGSHQTIYFRKSTINGNAWQHSYTMSVWPTTDVLALTGIVPSKWEYTRDGGQYIQLAELTGSAYGDVDDVEWYVVIGVAIPAYSLTDSSVYRYSFVQGSSNIGNGVQPLLNNVGALVSTGLTSGNVTFSAYSGSTQSLTAVVATPLSSDINSVAINVALVGSAKTFIETNTYFYRVAFVYDGIQEGPLSQVVTRVVPGAGFNYAACLVQIVLLNPLSSTSNQRISGINLYRAEATTTNASVPDGQYRIITPWNQTVAHGSVSWSGLPINGYMNINILDDNISGGATYDDRTGISETSTPLTAFTWKLGIISGGSLYVANCVHSLLPEAERYVFRSKAGRLDMFDWMSEYLIMQFVPTALMEWNGRVYVFGPNEFLSINTSGFFIDQKFAEYGVPSQDSVLELPEGLYFANANGCYFFNGQQIVNISLPIITKGTTTLGRSWKDMSHSTFIPIVTWFGKQEAVVFTTAHSTDGSVAFVYYPQSKRWDYWMLESATTASEVFVFGSPTGNVYYDDDTAVAHLAGSGSRKAWEWISKDFFGRLQTQAKKFFKIQQQGDATVTYYEDGQETTPRSLTGADSVTVSYQRARSMRVRLVGTNVQTTKGLAIIMRELIGRR